MAISIVATSKASSAPLVSVVVPTYRRPDLMRRCLDALFAQVGVNGVIEVIVVDDARSDEQAAALAGDFGRSDKIDLRYLCPPAGAHGPAAARNVGWRAARAEIIAFTDDDTIPDENWLAEGLAALGPGIDAAWGNVVVPLRPRPTDAERNVAGLNHAEFVTANCFVRQSALQLVGGFDERFERPWREDSDLYFMLLEAGCTVIAAPLAIVTHPARSAPPGTSLRQHHNMFFEALLYKKHPRLYRQKISAGPPLSYYLTVAAALVGLLALVAGNEGLALGAGAIWLLLTCRLALRRLRGTSTAFVNVADIVVSSALIPLLAVFWRLAGAVRFRVLFA